MPFLADIERSAGVLFLGTDRAWIAEAEPTEAADHHEAIDAGFHWLALAGGDPAGFLLAEQIGEAVHIDELAVAAEFQRRGLGTRLMAAAERHARLVGADAVTLTTYRDLAWNAPFYRRLGFAEPAADALPDHLTAALRREAATGHDPALRCAMVKPLA